MAGMDRFLDKAIVAACCLAVCGCALAESGAAQSPAAAGAQTLVLALSMLTALGCSAVFELARPPFNVLAPSVYCLAALACGQAAAFIPLAAYDFMRCVFRPDASRAAGLLALAALTACVARQALPPVAAIVLACITAAAAALSARTSSAEARQRIAYRTRDALKSQAITLRSKNRNLAEALEELESESTGRAARSNIERLASPNGRRAPNAECFAGPDGSHAPNDASAASHGKHRIANLNAGSLTASPGNSRTATPSASGAANSRAGAAGLAAGAADQALANPPRPAAFACLTEREWEVARLVAEGLDNREIAAEAYLSEGTVRNNISNILSKMSLKNRTQIAVTFWKSREN